MQETQVWSLDGEEPLEEGMAIHTSILAWRIPWTEEPGGLQSIGSHRVGHNWSDLAQYSIWDSLSILFYNKLSPTNFHICQWLLLESITIVIIAK